MLCDMIGMNFFKFEVKKSYRATNQAGFGKVWTVLENACPLSLSFKIKKIQSAHIAIQCLKNKWKKMQSAAATVGQIYLPQNENLDF